MTGSVMSPRMDVRIREAEPGEEAELLRLYEGLFAPDAQRFYEGRNPTATGYSYAWPL
jgi:hypothetical protein